MSAEADEEILRVASICAAYERGLEAPSQLSAPCPYRPATDESHAWHLGRAARNETQEGPGGLSRHEWLIKGRQRATGAC